MIRLSEGAYRVAIYAAAYGLVAVTHKGLGLLLFFWLVHALSQSEYAVFGLFYALQTGLIAIATAGVVEMVIGQHRRHVDQQGRQRLYGVGNGVFLWLTLVAAVGALGIYVGLRQHVSGGVPVGYIECREIHVRLWGGAEVLEQRDRQAVEVRCGCQPSRRVEHALLTEPMTGISGAEQDAVLIRSRAINAACRVRWHEIFFVRTEEG